MTGHALPSPASERLAHDLADGARARAFAEELARWLAASARFRAFAEANRDKIRKKLRTVAGPDGLRDVRAELLAGRLLLAERRIELAFEAYGSGIAGPDFTVTLAGERTFNLEVTRLHRLPGPLGFGRPLLAKLRQLPPSVPNALVVALEASSADVLDVDGAVRSIRARADAKNDAFFEGHGFRDPRAFYERFLRLGAVLVWCESAPAQSRVRLWTNGSARIRLPARAARVCVDCLRGDP